MIAHYANPFITNPWVSFDLLLIENNEIVLRVSKKFNDQTETEEEFNTLLLDEAKRTLDTLKEETPEIVGEITELKIDWPTINYEAERLALSATETQIEPIKVGVIKSWWNKFWGNK